MRKTATKLAIGLCCMTGTAAHSQKLSVATEVALMESFEPAPADFVFLGVAINGRDSGGSVMFARQGNRYFARPDDLDRWRVARGNAPEIMIRGEPFVDVQAVPGLTTDYDAQAQVMRLSIDSSAFTKVQREAADSPLKPTKSTSAAFLSYDMSFTYQQGAVAAAYLEGGVSDDWGLASNSMIVSHGPDGTVATRLDTYFLRDSPDQLTRLVVGDTATAASSWARPFRFAGLRIGSAFDLQPNFISFPTPVINGSNAVPSEVDVLVNNALRYQTQVDAGPFSVGGLPLVTGAGQITLRVRDALGLERQVTTSYYASPNLLRPGLAEWSVEAGMTRSQYGYRSLSYNKGFLSGGYRRALTPWFTAGGRAEITETAQAIGGEASIVVSPIGELGVTSAVSTSEAGIGTRYRVTASRVAPNWNVALSYERSSSAFRQPGADLGGPEASRQIQAAVSVTLGKLGSLGTSYTDLSYHNGNKVRIGSLNYNIGLANVGYLNLYALDTRSNNQRDTIVGLGLTLPLGAWSSAYMQKDKRGFNGEVRRTPASDQGWGYRLAVATGEIERQQADLDWRGPAGNYSFQATRYNNVNAFRFLASGSLVLADGQTLLGRKLGEAVAVVRVPGQANVRIYDENRLVARTDKNGVAMVTGLRPYASNSLSIAAADVPIDYQLNLTALSVVPRVRGAVVAIFDAPRTRPITIILHMPDGSPVASGTTITIAGSGQRLFIGYDGEAFINDASPGMTIIADTAQGKCVVALPDIGSGGLSSIDPLRCEITGERLDARNSS